MGAELPAVRLHFTAHARRDQRVLDRARQLLDKKRIESEGLTFDRDSVGFVRAAYWAAGVDLFAAEVAADANAHGVAILFRTAALRRQLHRQAPEPGDLLFLDCDPQSTALYPSQVAIVEEQRPDGTVTAIGYFEGGARRVRLNLRRPQDPARNDMAGKVPVARLFRSFARPL
jgi:hypothetical protein